MFEGVKGSTPAAVDPALAVSFLHWGFLAWALVATTTITFSILSDAVNPCVRTLLVNIVPRSWVDGPIGHLADGLLWWPPSPAPWARWASSHYSSAMPQGNCPGSPTVPACNPWWWCCSPPSSQHPPSYSEGNQVAVGAQRVAHPGHGGRPAAVGPGLWLIQHFFSGFLTYLIHLPQMALTPNAVPANWVNGWTVFYWGWFLGYALMGLFTAGVSRGRSIRELVLAVAILCPIVTNLWFTLLGAPDCISN